MVVLFQTCRTEGLTTAKCSDEMLVTETQIWVTSSIEHNNNKNFQNFRARAKMAPSTMKMGVGAHVSCLIKFLHPTAVREKFYPNTEKGKRLENLVVVR